MNEPTRNQRPGIFLSHTRADKPFARLLAYDLAAAGAKVWIDEAEIKLGDSLVQKISQGIDEMDYLAVILSPESVDSEWVRRELEVAINEEIQGRRVKVLPILHRPCELPAFLRGRLYADFTETGDYETSLLVILDRLGLEDFAATDLDGRLAASPDKTEAFGLSLSDELMLNARAHGEKARKSGLRGVVLGVGGIVIGGYIIEFIQRNSLTPVWEMPFGFALFGSMLVSLHLTFVGLTHWFKSYRAWGRRLRKSPGVLEELRSRRPLLSRLFFGGLPGFAVLLVLFTSLLVYSVFGLIFLGLAGLFADKGEVAGIIGIILVGSVITFSGSSILITGNLAWRKVNAEATRLLRLDLAKRFPT